MEELEEEGRNDRRDRDAEDGARDAGDARPDEDRAQHDDRMDADGSLHDPRLHDVHDDEPADDHQDQRGYQGFRLEDEGDKDRWCPRRERSEERDHLEQAGEDGGQRHERQAEQQVGAERDQEVDDAHQGLAAQEPAERPRDRRLEQPRLLCVGWRDQPEHEGQDLVPVDDHVDGQEEHDQHRAYDAEAGHGDLLERRDQSPGDLVEVVQDGGRLVDQVDLAEADGVQSVLPGADDLRQVGADVRQRGDQLGDRRGQGPGGEDDDDDEDRHHARIDDDRGERAWQPRDDVDHARDDRADDEREQPRQKERQQDVAEVEEDRAELPDHHEEESDRGQREDRRDETTIATLRAEVLHLPQRSPIL